MDKKQFNPVIVKHDLYQGLCGDGLLESENKNPQGMNLYIIGLDISYATIDYHDFNKFTLLFLSDSMIRNTFINVFGEQLLLRRQKQETSAGNLLLELLDNNKSSDVTYRSHNIVNYFAPTRLPIFSFDKIKEILVIPEIVTKYEHIDINLGVKFNK